MRFLDDPRIPADPYPELLPVLRAFVEGVASVLGENLVGIYLVGSIATGDFDLDSDVDFMVITNADVTEADMGRLQDLQVRIHAMDCYPARHLEGSYISIGDLNDWGIVGEKEFYYFDNGSTVYERTTHDNRWHVRWVLRERGIPLVGPQPAAILRAVPAAAMLAEIRAMMSQNLAVFQADLDCPLGFCNSRFGQSFFVLTFCRMLHTLHTGEVRSKKAGKEWAKEHVDPKWVELIDQAWEEREGVRFCLKIRQRAEQDLLNRTLDFLAYAVGQMGSTNS